MKYATDQNKIFATSAKKNFALQNFVFATEPHFPVNESECKILLQSERKRKIRFIRLIPDVTKLFTFPFLTLIDI